jgi:hypothetical protein
MAMGSEAVGLTPDFEARIGDSENAPNDRFRDLIEIFSIGVHRRSSAVEILFRPRARNIPDGSEES